jgi:type III restriction enzyme
MEHYDETPLGKDDYEIKVTRGFMLLQPQPLNVPPGQSARDFRQAVSPASQTPKQIFRGFRKCCYTLQKFDSDPERRFAVLIDADSSVQKWIKPGKAQFQIEYRSGQSYEPDFVVETGDCILICEIKAQNELNDPIVMAKAQAAAKWCTAASQHAADCGGKPWSYLLIPDDRVIGAATFEGLIATFTRG